MKMLWLLITMAYLDKVYQDAACHKYSGLLRQNSIKLPLLISTVVYYGLLYQAADARKYVEYPSNQGNLPYIYRAASWLSGDVLELQAGCREFDRRLG